MEGLLSYYRVPGILSTQGIELIVYAIRKCSIFRAIVQFCEQKKIKISCSVLRHKDDFYTVLLLLTQIINGSCSKFSISTIMTNAKITRNIQTNEQN